jgi:hypothetical protein
MAGGERHMDIDHFDPTIAGAARNAYSNLMLATHHCNLKKREYWPTIAERRQGIRLLNPCEEMDYGVHLFEDPNTHELVGTTRAGRYHIDICDLNHPTFVFERKRRSEYLRLKKDCPALMDGAFEDIASMLTFVNDVMERFIPEIASPPQSL